MPSYIKKTGDLRPEWMRFKNNGLECVAHASSVPDENRGGKAREKKTYQEPEVQSITSRCRKYALETEEDAGVKIRDKSSFSNQRNFHEIRFDVYRFNSGLSNERKYKMQ